MVTGLPLCKQALNHTVWLCPAFSFKKWVNRRITCRRIYTYANRTIWKYWRKSINVYSTTIQSFVLKMTLLPFPPPPSQAVSNSRAPPLFLWYRDRPPFPFPKPTSDPCPDMSNPYLHGLTHTDGQIGHLGRGGGGGGAPRVKKKQGGGFLNKIKV